VAHRWHGGLQVQMGGLLLISHKLYCTSGMVDGLAVPGCRLRTPFSGKVAKILAISIVADRACSGWPSSHLNFRRRSLACAS
jgi:hypothetical protein